jgi:GAF domain
MRVALRNELDRLKAVKRFDSFNFDMNNNFQDLLRLASDVFATPVAFITLLDEHDQWFKATRGYEVLCMPRATSFCTHTIRHTRAMAVPDAQSDTRFADNPLVFYPPHIRFYAGAPLTTYDGYNIGTLCVMDVAPRQSVDDRVDHLDIIARQVMYLMELQLTYSVLNEKMEQIARQNEALMKIAHIQSHEFRGPLCTITGLMNLIKEDQYASPTEYLQLMEQAVETLDGRIHAVVKATELAESSYVA